jgi:hypothetical protein
LKIQIPRLASGQGSNVIINLSTSKLKADPITVYATYDQGSVSTSIAGIYDYYISYLPIIIPSIAAAVSFIFLVERISQKNYFRYIAAKIYNDIESKVPKAFKNNPLNQQLWVTEDSVYSSRLWAKPQIQADKTKFFDKDDLSLLYEFFSRLIERDSVIKDMPDPMDDKLIVQTTNDEFLLSYR